MRRPELLLALLAATTAGADLGAGLSACARIDDSAARLACYDGLAQRLVAAAPAPLTPPAPPAVVFAPAAPAPVVATPVPPPASPEPSGTIRSQLKGEFQGWEPKMLLYLANGQVWRCMTCTTQPLSRSLVEPAVTIEESFTGAWFLSIDGTSMGAKVRQVR